MNLSLQRQNRAVELEVPEKSSPASHSSSNYGYGYSEPPGSEDGKHFQDYWHSVRRHTWLIVGLAIVTTLLAAIYMARQPDVYEAHARVQVDLEDNPGYSAASKGTSIIVNGTNDPIYFNTQLQILTSSGLLRRVVKTLDLEHNQEFLHPQAAQNRSTLQSLLSMIGLNKRQVNTDKNNPTDLVPRTAAIAPAGGEDELAEAARLEGLVGSLQKGLTVEPVKETRTTIKETRLIDVSFQHADAQIAARIANAVADIYVRSNLEKKSGNGVLTSDFLQQRIVELQSEIRTGEEHLMSYAKDHRIISLDPNQNTVVERLTGLNRQLLEAENDRKLAEAAYRASLAPGAAEALAEKDARQTVEAESKLADLRQRRAQMMVQDTEKMPEVQEIDRQMAVLEQQINGTRRRAIDVLTTNLETQYRQAQARENSLRSAFEQQRAETITQNEAAINYRIIQQEIQTNKSLLEALLQRAKENDVTMAGLANNVHVIDYSSRPKNPVSPQRWQNVGLAFIFALGLGIALALFLDFVDDSLQTSDEVERVLRLPALANIPTFKRTRRRVALQSTTALELSKDRQNGSHPELLIDADPHSSLAESFRHLRTTVLLSTPGRAPKTLLVTSSVQNEGKTSSAVNTALILAQTGVRVLVIDADMRNPRLHQLFGLENNSGLSNILSRDFSGCEVLDYVQKHDTNVFVLTSGPLPANPSELLGSEQMLGLLAKLSASFDHIVIDSPPVSYFTDSVLLSLVVDGVLLVVHSGKSSRQVVRRAKRSLQDVGAKIFGVVLNHTKTVSPTYYHYN
jgi:capsular exopolysaccharide synthesis family protein